jgi:hypothetical protein
LRLAASEAPNHVAMIEAFGRLDLSEKALLPVWLGVVQNLGDVNDAVGVSGVPDKERQGLSAFVERFGCDPPWSEVGHVQRDENSKFSQGSRRSGHNTHNTDFVPRRFTLERHLQSGHRRASFEHHL